MDLEESRKMVKFLFQGCRNVSTDKAVAKQMQKLKFRSQKPMQMTDGRDWLPVITAPKVQRGKSQSKLAVEINYISRFWA